MLQLSLLPALRLFGVVPNLVLVVVTLVALNVVTTEALAVAVLSGLILDLAGSAYFGLWTGALVLVTLVVGLMGRAGIELDGLWVALAVVAAGTVVITLAIWSSLAAAGGGFPVSVAWNSRLVVELVLNLVLVTMLRPLLRMLAPRGGQGLEPGE
jgi:rod shape-determining protein MreD